MTASGPRARRLLVTRGTFNHIRGWSASSAGAASAPQPCGASPFERSATHARNAAEAGTLYAAGNDPDNDYGGVDVAALQLEGFNQTEGYTTVAAEGATPDIINITTTCPNGGTATFTSEGTGGQLDVRGEVQYTP